MFSTVPYQYLELSDTAKYTVAAIGTRSSLSLTFINFFLFLPFLTTEVLVASTWMLWERCCWQNLVIQHLPHFSCYPVLFSQDFEPTVLRDTNSNSFSDCSLLHPVTQPATFACICRTKRRNLKKHGRKREKFSVPIADFSSIRSLNVSFFFEAGKQRGAVSTARSFCHIGALNQMVAKLSMVLPTT